MDQTQARPLLIDGLQYSRWSEEILKEVAQAGLSAVHATVAYHGGFRDLVEALIDWNRLFERHPDLVFPGRSGDDVRMARAEGRTAIFFGLQNPSPIEDDIGLIEICHTLGIRFMQLTYNNQSLLASGCYEERDGGISRMGREAIREMNRLGMVIDMSHSGRVSTLEAIELSERPIAITHANPDFWHPSVRNKSADVLKELAESGGMLGFSLYTHHLRGGSECTLDDFCAMVAETAELIGAEHLGIGSDLCQDQPDEVVTFMRNGRWTRSGEPARFPPQPSWFARIRDFPGLAAGLRKAGFAQADVDGILGLNWLGYYDRSFGPLAVEPAALKGAA